MRYIKFVDCPDCGGHGFITYTRESGNITSMCKKCSGTGSISVPITNADRIRAMTDDELAGFICNLQADCYLCQGYDLCNLVDEGNGLVKWLQQPVEEGGGT